MSSTLTSVWVFATLTFRSPNGTIAGVDWFYKEFGRRVREARAAAELTQEGLADRVRLSRTSIANIERGQQHVPLHMLALLASALGTEPAALLPDPQVPSGLDVVSPKLLSQVAEEHQGWVKRVVRDPTPEASGGSHGTS